MPTRTFLKSAMKDCFDLNNNFADTKAENTNFVVKPFNSEEAVIAIYTVAFEASIHMTCCIASQNPTGGHVLCFLHQNKPGTC